LFLPVEGTPNTLYLSFASILQPRAWSRRHATMRVGIGYDIHRFAANGGTLMLGGIRIPHPRGLAGHSDADVLLHAVADALLGAIGSPDLGELFPSSDARYRKAESRIFVQEACRRVRREGWRVGNLDATVVADAPRLTPYKTTMRQAIGRLLRVPASAVSIKAKTTEGLPPDARGIVAHVVVLLKRATSDKRQVTSGFRRSKTGRQP